MDTPFKNIDTMAIHEAGHFTIYLANCIEASEQPWIQSMSIKPRIYNHKRIPGYVHRPSVCTPEYVSLIANSELPSIAKDYNKAAVNREIKTLLAGNAAELIQFEIEKINFKRVLTYYYKKDKKDVYSDLSRAVALNVAIGEQILADGALPLIKLFQKTVEDVLYYSDEVIHVARILEGNTVIIGDHLEQIINDVMQMLGTKTQSIFKP